jgi:hypothetical protein
MAWAPHPPTIDYLPSHRATPSSSSMIARGDHVVQLLAKTGFSVRSSSDWSPSSGTGSK